MDTGGRPLIVQHTGQQVDGARRRAATTGDQLGGTSALQGGGLGVQQAAADKLEQLVSVSDDLSCLPRDEYLYDVTKILGMGPETDGHAIGGWFNHVLTATRSEAAADEADGRRTPPGTQFADRVDE